MKALKVTLLITLAVSALQGCSSHRFVPTGDSPREASKGSQCGATVLRQMPSPPYRELGLCYAKVPGGGMISDNTPEAIEELQKCACEAGGDAVVLHTSDDQGYVTQFGSSQQTVKVQGVVVLRGTK